MQNAFIFRDFQLLAFLTYLLVLIWLLTRQKALFVFDSKTKLTTVLVASLSLLFVVSRVYGLDYAIKFDHPDFTYFIGGYDSFLTQIQRNQGNYFSLTFAKMAILCFLDSFPFSIFVFVMSGLIPILFLKHTEFLDVNLYSTIYSQVFPHFFSPLLNLMFIILLLVLAKKYILRDSSTLGLFLIFFFLILIPTHLYMGTTISYNFFAEAVQLSALLSNLWFVKALQEFISLNSDSQKAPINTEFWDRLRQLFYAMIATTFLIGFSVAVKLLVLPMILVVILQAVLIQIWMVYRFRVQVRTVHVVALILSLLPLVLSVGFYMLLMSPWFYLDAKSFGVNWAYILYLASIPATAPFSYRLDYMLYENLRPNLGGVLLTMGILGYFVFGLRSWLKAQVPKIVIWLWAGICFWQNCMPTATTDDRAAMTRNILLMGLCAMFAVYLIVEICHLAKIRRLRAKIAVAALLSAQLVSIFICTTVFMYDPTAMHFSRYLATIPTPTLINAPFTTLQCYMYGVRCKSSPTHLRADSKGGYVPIVPPEISFREVPLTIFASNDPKVREDLAKEALEKYPADHWIFDTAVDPNYSKQLHQLLESQGYTKTTFAPEFPWFKGTFIDSYYKDQIRGLFAERKLAGLFSPAWLHLYSKKEN